MLFRKSLALSVLALGLSSLVAQLAVAYDGGFDPAPRDAVPTCLSYGKPLANNNQQVMHWKRTTQNQFRERGNVTGNITRIFSDKNGHDHFEIALGRDANDVLEVIYNTDFGALPPLKVGLTVQACGDFIVSTAPSGPYPASPSGAIIHWVHTNPSGRGHDPGFLVIDGQLCGQDAEHAGPPSRRPGKGKKGGRSDGDNGYTVEELYGIAQ